MRYKLLTTPWQRSLGAMFKKSLDNLALVFAYPHPAPRLFHTAFCQPLRILALDDQGEILFDQMVHPWRFVRIPASRVIVELAPDAEVNEEELCALACQSTQETQLEVGSWSREATLETLFFILLAEAVKDIRRVNEANMRAKTLCADLLIKCFKPWERGQILGSAALVLEGADHMEMPENAVRISHQVIEIEKQAGYMEQLLAASIAGSPWEFPNVCFKCGYPAFWRPILTQPAGMPDEVAWRYARPENHIPLCKRCAYVVNWKSTDVQHELGYMLWGVRFEALVAWHEGCAQQGWNHQRWAEAWDLERYPLWPECCGGPTWATGSGAFEHATSLEPNGVYRREEHCALLEKYFQRKPVPRPFLTSPQPVLVGLEPSYSMQGAAI